LLTFLFTSLNSTALKFCRSWSACFLHFVCDHSHDCKCFPKINGDTQKKMKIVFSKCFSNHATGVTHVSCSFGFHLFRVSVFIFIGVRVQWRVKTMMIQLVRSFWPIVHSWMIVPDDYGWISGIFPIVLKHFVSQEINFTRSLNTCFFTKLWEIEGLKDTIRSSHKDP
jgi:hypothetical protein